VPVPNVDRPARPVLSPPELPSSDGRTPPAPWVEPWHKPIFIPFLAVSLTLLALVGLRIKLDAGWRWIEGLWICLAAGTSLLALGKRLPLQNVLMTVVLITSISGGILLVGAAAGVPFGPLVYSEALGERIFQLLPWPMPLLWVVVLINGRGVARLIMRPWRKTNLYGFWVIGLTCLLAVVFDLGLEPFAASVQHWWIWQPTRSRWLWYGAPWVNSLGWLVAALAILVFTTPWLINKQPVKRPMDYHPLIVWALMNLILAAGNAAHALWPPVWLSLIGNTAATLFAIRGARW